MDQLQAAIRAVEIIIAVLVIVLLGDYLGHKIGRRRLLAIVGVFALVTVVIFAIYAAVLLA